MARGWNAWNLALILVVEDEPDLAALITDLLADARYRVETAAEFSDGAVLLSVSHPALLVANVMLHDGGNGYRVADSVPAIQKVNGFQSCKIYSGAGALRADIRLVAEMQHAGIDEGLLRDPSISPMLGTFYGAMDLTTSAQMFIREVTPDLLKALSS